MKNKKGFKWEVKSWQELTRGDIYAIGKLRIEIFVVEQNCPYQDFDGNDDKSDHLICYDEFGEIIAYSRIVFPGVSYEEVSIGRVVVKEKARGQKLGNSLMKKSIAFVRDKYGKATIHISAQEHLFQFYNKLGFLKVTEMYLEDDIPHIGMELDLK